MPAEEDILFAEPPIESAGKVVYSSEATATESHLTEGQKVGKGGIEQTCGADRDLLSRSGSVTETDTMG